MNNKSDKKHKRKQKQKQINHNKKTASKSKKKKEIQSGGMPFFSAVKSLFSRNNPKSNTMSQLKQPFLQKSNSTINQSSSASPNPQSSVSSPNPQPLTNAVSSTGSYNLTTKITSNQNKWNNQNKLSQLQQPLLPKSNRLANAQPTNSNNFQRNVSQTPAPANSKNPPQTISQAQPPPPPPPPPSAQPQGFNTLKAQSRCSIM